MTIKWNDTVMLHKINELMDGVSSKGADMVAKDARRLVPVKTGALKKTIVTKKSKFADGGHVVSMGGGLRHYGTFIELGASGKPARPFMRPALNKNKRKIRKMYRDALE